MRDFDDEYGKKEFDDNFRDRRNTMQWRMFDEI